MSRKISQIMIFAGAALIVAACALMIYNKVDDNRAGQRSQDLLEQMLEQMFDDDFVLPEYVEVDGTMQLVAPQRTPGQTNQASAGGGGTLEYTNAEDSGEAFESDETAEGGEASSTASKPVQAPTYSTLGVLQIPAISLKLPIIDGWTDARGNIAPCSIAGSANFKPRRLIIAGHNLKSHFKSLIDLNVGDEVLFTAKDGSTYRYSVVEVGQCHRDNPEEVSSGEGWDITLVTCKTIRTMRTLVRCAEIPEEKPEVLPEAVAEEIAETPESGAGA